MKNLQKWVLLIGSILLTIFLIFSGLFPRITNSLGEFGIIGVLIAGVFFGFSFTVVPGTAALIYFTGTFHPLIIAFIGAVGTMIGNLIIFNYFKDDLPDEIETVLEKSHIRKLRKSKLSWLVPGLAGIIIASPLPDELGIALLGIEKFDTNEFMLLSFSLTFIGLLILTSIAWVI